MNTYMATYKNKQMEVSAETSYDAQLKGAALFKARKSYEVNIMLLEIDGVPYVHTAYN